MIGAPALFLPGDGGFVATEWTRGPWSRDHQHGGPPAALLVRALERLAGDEFLLARATFDFLRPVPIAPLRVTAGLSRAGARVRRLQGDLSTGDGTVVVQATAVAIRRTAVLTEGLTDEEVPPPPPRSAPVFEFPFFRDVIAYHRAVEVRLARGTWGKGPVVAWGRVVVPVVAGEVASPMQRLLVVADSASGLAVVLDPTQHTFVNADLTVAVHRAPAGEWIGLHAATVAEADGVGLTRSRLWDEHGAVGVTLQGLVIDPRRS
jgi:hypothetical protein